MQCGVTPRSDRDKPPKPPLLSDLAGRCGESEEG